MKLIIIILTIILLAITSCDTTNPKPPEEKPEGYQEDIPWPSLADSPWPMYHHDPQSTGRSKYAGPQIGVIETRSFDHFETMSGISIGYDKTAFLPSGDLTANFIAFGYNGTPIWNSVLSSTSTPLISSDSTVYIASIDTFFALNHVGDTLWNTSIDKMYNIGINIDKDGNLYFVDFKDGSNYQGMLKVLDKNGNIIWTLQDERILGTPDAAPTFSPGVGTTLIAFSVKTRSILWKFGGENVYCNWSMVDSQGNIYVSTSINEDTEDLYFISLKPDNSIRWTYPHTAKYKSGNRIYNKLAQPTIDKNGNLYFASDTLYSLNYNGRLRWKRPLSAGVLTPLVCDLDNNIYVEIVGPGYFDQACFNDSGSMIFYLTNLEGDWGFSPAFGYDDLIVPSDESHQIYSIK